ncbi:MAG: heavy metal-responsive transcriptional regulator [Candidatus Sericytochromatia bacterium]|nr:heavy metal-responsive transcriptional regulator [Candidatus Sericytochromatia bacterium]
MGAGVFIGDAAKQVNMSVKTIRYYEGVGLLGEPQRSDSGYRLFYDTDIQRLTFIKGAKALGLSLTEIKETLGLWAQGIRPCGHVEALLAEKLTDLDRRIAELTAFRDGLASYMDRQATQVIATGVPCKHIDGAAAGVGDLVLPQPVLTTDKRSASAS